MQNNGYQGGHQMKKRVYQRPVMSVCPLRPCPLMLSASQTLHTNESLTPEDHLWYSEEEEEEVEHW